jgi:5-formyltetrahydrofolate cyclo-ligase
MNAQPPSPEHDADCSAFRAALRREKLAVRQALTAIDHSALSSRLTLHLAALLNGLPPQTLAFCAPVRGEFDAGPLVGELLAKGWKAAMPVVVTPGAPMIFRAWTPACAMSADRHGIPIPRDGAEIDPDIVLLPLVAFDDAGYRLGYGSGYFDRTLAARVPRPLAIGVGFELGRVADIRPQAHDVCLDAVVTEAGVFRT